MIGEILLAALVGKTMADNLPPIDYSVDIDRDNHCIDFDLDINDYKERKKRYDERRDYYNEKHERKKRR